MVRRSLFKAQFESIIVLGKLLKNVLKKIACISLLNL